MLTLARATGTNWLMASSMAGASIARIEMAGLEKRRDVRPPLPINSHLIEGAGRRSQVLLGEVEGIGLLGDQAGHRHVSLVIVQGGEQAGQGNEGVGEDAPEARRNEPPT